jgi:serine/threonine-protein kinase
MADDSPSTSGKILPNVGSYRLLHTLGAGGMSSVFKGVHLETGHVVAVKILPRTLAKNPTLLQRFLREAKSAEALEHPNIVAIYDRGMDAGRHYLVLEYVPGGDVHDQVRANGPMTLKDALAIIRPVAEGLRFAASQGLIHRDIKPANILKTPDGRVKITDLGLALHADDEDERVTREGTTVGTVDFMAPEQARDSRATSIRSDIYSLGCTLYFLLTAQPPYPGGDVAEKLNRHINYPPPDPRDLRPELPPTLSRLLLRMMAKQPEDRFEDYDELLTALDVVANPAVFAPTGAPLYDLPDEDDDPDLDLFTLPAPLDRSLAESGSELGLIPLRDESFPEKSGRKSPSSTVVYQRSMKPTALDLLDDNHETFELAESVLTGPVAERDGRTMSQSDKSWLTTWILLGILLVLLVIGGDQIYRASSTRETTAQQTRIPDVEEATPPPRPPSLAIDRPPIPKVESLTASKKKFRVTTPPPPPLAASPPPWAEPSDPVAKPVVEPDFGAGADARYLPDWARGELPLAMVGKVVEVRRVSEPGGDVERRSSLQQALEVPGVGTVEFADNGPFFESKLRVVTDSKILRAKVGFRPIVALERSSVSDSANPDAFLDLADKSLVFEGLDLIVDASDLPRSVTTLIQCLGGSLTFRDCTVTVINNRSGVPISLVRAASAEKPMKVLFERTLVRGALTSVLDLSKGAGDVVFNRSVVLNGQGSLLSAEVTNGPERRLFALRSVLASVGPALQWLDGSPRIRPRPIPIRALGTTFAHIASPTRTSLLASRGSPCAATDLVNWQGDFNAFAGWVGWLSMANERDVPIPRIDDARTIWPGTDPSSITAFEGWPAGTAVETWTPTMLLGLAKDRGATLAAVPTPSVFIREKTIGRFPRPSVPVEAAQLTPAVSPGGLGVQAQAGLPLDAAGNPGVFPQTSAAASKGVRVLSFDADAGSGNASGDLGRFLAESIRKDDKLVRIRVRGSLARTWTPVRIPEGVSLEIVVEPNQAGMTPSWRAPTSCQAEALIELSGGSLAMDRVRMIRDGSSSLKELIRVESGHLLLLRCSLTSPGLSEIGGGGLVAFLARGTKPLNQSDAMGGPFEAFPDRPTCRIIDSVLISGGDVLTADVGRGLLALSGCAVASGRSAFVLNPAGVARDRFDADLCLDHCTVASESNVVTLGRWPGSAPGPARPWLVSTESCAFFGSFEHPPRDRDRESVMLRTEPNSFASGVLFWQSRSDAFEFQRFTIAGTAACGKLNQKADLRRNWIDLWGDGHFRGSTGPRAIGSSSPVKLFDRLQPGKVTAGDLTIDPDTIPASLRNARLGADLARLGITPSPRSGRKR